MKVKCPKCERKYKIDDHRVPDAGLKMRCPKCSTSFLVKKSTKTKAFGSDVGTEFDLPDATQVDSSKKINLPAVPEKPKLKKGTIAFGAPKKPAPIAMGEMDLPGPIDSSETSFAEEDDPFGEVDLPGMPDNIGLPGKPEEIDLPAPTNAIGLPAPTGSNDLFSSRDSGVDFPAPVDSVADLPTPADVLLDLPTPADTGIDLPTPANVMDLPAPNTSIDLPTPATMIGLPTPSTGSVDLPTPANVVDLPTPNETTGLPTPATQVDLPSPADAFDDEGSSTSDTFGNIDLSSALPPSLQDSGTDRADGFQSSGFPTLKSEIPPPSSHTGKHERMSSGDFPEISPNRSRSASKSLPPLGSLAGGAFPTVDDGAKLPSIEPISPADAPSMSDVNIATANRVHTSGATDFGQVDLKPSSGESDTLTGPELDTGDGEFDGFPTERDTHDDASHETGLDLALDPRDLDSVGLGMDEADTMGEPAPDGERRPAATFSGRRKYERQSRRTKIALLIGLGFLILAGGALSFTPFGPFGAYEIAKLLPSGTDDALIAQIKGSLLKNLALDNANGINNSQKGIQSAAAQDSINEDLKLLGVYAYNWDQLRFGFDKENNPLSGKLLGSINLNESESPFAPLAKASQLALVRNVEQVEATLKNATGNTPEGLSLLTITYLGSGMNGKAVDTARKLASKEKSPRAGYLLARGHIQSESYKEAITHLKAFIESYPKHLDGTLAYAEALVSLMPVDKPKIQKLMTGLLNGKIHIPTARQKAQAHAILARLHVIDRRYTEAKKEINHALELDTHNLFALIDKGEVALKQGDLSAASISFKLAITRSPTNLVARLGQIETLLEEGNLTQAKEALMPYFAKNPGHARVQFLMAEVQRFLKENKEAQKGYLKAIELDKEFLEAYIALSEYYLEAKLNKEAMKILDMASEAAPNSPLINQALADAHAAGRDYASAIIELSKAIDLDPGDPSSHFRMGQMYRKMKTLDDANMAFDEVEKIDTNFPGLAMERGIVMELSGQTASALSVYKKALTESKDDNNLKIRVAAASHMLGDNKTAEELLGEVITHLPQSAEVNYFLGEVYRVTNRPADAIRLLRNACQIEEKSALYRLRFGMALMNAKKNTEAMRELNQSLDFDPDMAETYLRIGQIRLQHGAAKTAIESFDKALALDPQLYEAYEFVAEAFEQLSDERSAVAYYRKAAAALPDNAEVFFKLGLAELNTHGRRVAIRSLARSVKLGDTDKDAPSWLPEAMYHLGSAQQATGMKPSAIKTFKRYLEIAPANHIDRTEVTAHLNRLGQ